jgi:hypothetical protein
MKPFNYTEWDDVRYLADKHGETEPLKVFTFTGLEVVGLIVFCSFDLLNKQVNDHFLEVNDYFLSGYIKDYNLTNIWTIDGQSIPDKPLLRLMMEDRIDQT